MIFNADDHRVIRNCKGVVPDAFNDIPELDPGADSLAVGDDGVAVLAVPAVDLDAPGSLPQDPGVSLHA